MHSKSLVKLLEAHKRLDVPLVHSVALLARLRGIALSTIARDAGYHRNTLYQALIGDLSPPAHLRRVAAEKLGVDPWSIYGPPSD